MHQFQAPTNKPITTTISDKALMQEVWRQGFLRPGGFTVRTSTKKLSINLRFVLYNAVRAYRSYKEEPDLVLQDAINYCEVALVEDENGWGVCVRGKLQSEAAQSIVEQLGITPRSVEELRGAESLQRVVAAAEQALTPRQSPISDSQAPTSGAPAPRDFSSKYGTRN